MTIPISPISRNEPSQNPKIGPGRIAVETHRPVGRGRDGAWGMAEDARCRKDEVAALRAGFDLGMTLVDTAEMYADGGAEALVGEAIAGRRDELFLVFQERKHRTLDRRHARMES